MLGNLQPVLAGCVAIVVQVVGADSGGCFVRLCRARSIPHSISAIFFTVPFIRRGLVSGRILAEPPLRLIGLLERVEVGHEILEGQLTEVLVAYRQRLSRGYRRSLQFRMGI